MKRPVRLCDATRRFAYESLDRKYGLETMKTNAISLDGVEDFSSLSTIEKHDVAIRKIAAIIKLRRPDWPLIHEETMILLIHVYKVVHLIHTQIAVGESSCDCTFRPVCGELHAYHILIILSIPVSV